MKPQKCIFVLPWGFALGGVSTWSSKMTKQIISHDSNAILIRHTEREDTPIDDSLMSETLVVRCPGKSAWFVEIEDLISYIPTYYGALPGTFIPNYSFDTYATCALLSLTESRNMRVIGFAHSDEDIYYEVLQHYEPIIHIFVAVSKEIASKLKVLMPHRKHDIVTRCYPIDIPQKLDRNYSLSSAPIRLMYGGRLENYQKRVYDLVNLVKFLEQDSVDFHLSIVGSGTEENYLRKEFASLYNSSNFQNRVTFEGNVPHHQMQDYWKSSDICILVSDFEGTSISMLEAMSQGCIPIVTDVSGTNAIICDGVNGFTVPIGDMNKMAHIIKSLSQCRDQLQKIGTESYHTVLSNENFSFESYVKWFLQMNELVWDSPPRQWSIDRLLLPSKQLPEPPFKDIISLLYKKIARKLIRNKIVSQSIFN
jgi:glycosyltransferase involved in cell wall biosynthesis